MPTLLLLGKLSYWHVFLPGCRPVTELDNLLSHIAGVNIPLQCCICSFLDRHLPILDGADVSCQLGG